MKSSRIYWLERTEVDVPEDDEWLTYRERDCLQHFFIPKRRSEWRLGRWTIKCAVCALGRVLGFYWTVKRVEVTVADSGAPRVRVPDAKVRVSLSHRAGIAMCTVTPAIDALGCDVELVEPHSETFVKDYFTSDEQLRVSSSQNDTEKAILSTLFWSGKESVLKAMELGLRGDPCAVSITIGDDKVIGVCDPPSEQCWRPFQISIGRPFRLQGWWRREGAFVRTIAGMSSGLPVSLEGAGRGSELGNDSDCSLGWNLDRSSKG